MRRNVLAPTSRILRGEQRTGPDSDKAQDPLEFDRLLWIRLILQTCPRPAFNYFSVVPVGSNENAFQEKEEKKKGKMKEICEYKLTLRRSGLYPRLAIAEAILRARRPPDRARMNDVALALATARGEAFVLRVTIFIPAVESEISMTCSNQFRS